jgi:hypothetical protein
MALNKTIFANILFSRGQCLPKHYDFKIDAYN